MLKPEMLVKPPTHPVETPVVGTEVPPLLTIRESKTPSPVEAAVKVALNLNERSGSVARLELYVLSELLVIFYLSP